MYAHIWGPLFRITGRSAAGVTGHQFIAPILLSFVRGMQDSGLEGQRHLGFNSLGCKY